VCQRRGAAPVRRDDGADASLTVGANKDRGISHAERKTAQVSADQPLRRRQAAAANPQSSNVVSTATASSIKSCSQTSSAVKDALRQFADTRQPTNKPP
jgi:hypothetical protein